MTSNARPRKYYIAATVLSAFSLILLINIVVNLGDRAWLDAGFYFGGLILFFPGKASIAWMSLSVRDGLVEGSKVQHWIGTGIMASCALLKLL